MMIIPPNTADVMANPMNKPACRIKYSNAPSQNDMFHWCHLSTPPGGVTLGISGWGRATGTLEPLAFTRASFRWILLPYTRVNSPNHSYPRVLPVAKNSPKRGLTLSLDTSFRFSTPNPGRVAAGVAGYMLRHAKYVHTHYHCNFNQYLYHRFPSESRFLTVNNIR